MFKEFEIEELVEKITEWRKAYYAGKPKGTDQEYDALEMKLKELDPENSIFGDVGADIRESTFEKYEHKVPMLSLDKAYSVEEVNKWAPCKEGLKMPKMDGFALSIHYKLENDKYVLVRGVTRGKGVYGEDITENVKMVDDIPKEIPAYIITKVDTFNGTNLGLIETHCNITEFEVRGETYMKRSTFQDLELYKEFENCRNIAPGSMRQKDPRVTKARKLNFAAYNIIGIDLFTMSERLSFLKRIGFPIVDFEKVTLTDEKALIKIFDDMSASREKRDYDIDGIVLCADDCKLIEDLGNTSHHPRAFIAWKFEAEEAETTYNETQWQVSRIGLVNPVGIFNAVRIDGASITNATLHNLTEIERLGLGIGDRIIVSRRGGVIPKIERVVKSAGNPVKIPGVCPVCGSPTRVNVSINDEGEEIKTLYCTNFDCPAVTLTKILHFVKVMEIDEVAESMLTKLLEAGYIETSVDLFKVTKDQLLTLPSVKDKMAEKVLKNIGLARKRTLGVFLAALGIRMMGKNIAQLVADVFGSLDAVLAAGESDFSSIAGIGPEIAKSIYSGLRLNAELIERLRKEVEITGKKVVSGDLPLSGKSFLITGTLSKGRKEFEKIIIENGGEVRDSVSKTLSFLIVGADPGSKVQKAQKAGVKLLTEEEFMEMLLY